MSADLATGKDRFLFLLDVFALEHVYPVSHGFAFVGDPIIAASGKHKERRHEQE